MFGVPATLSDLDGGYMSVYFMAICSSVMFWLCTFLFVCLFVIFTTKDIQIKRRAKIVTERQAETGTRE